MTPPRPQKPAKRVAARRRGVATEGPGDGEAGAVPPTRTRTAKPSAGATRPSARRPGVRARANGPSSPAASAAPPQAAVPPQPATVAASSVDGAGAVAGPAGVGEGSDVAHEHLQQIQRSLGALLHDVDHGGGDAEARRRAARAMEHIAARLDPTSESQPQGAAGGLAPRQLLSADHYLRKWARYAMRNRSEEVDDFGLDPAYEARAQPLLDTIFHSYFRVQVQGIEHVPDRGRALLVSNHSGALPWDGAMLKTAVRAHHPEQRPVRWLAEDFAFHAPFLGPMLNRIGAVRACPENAARLLEQEALVGVFPEGIKGISKLFRERYQLQRFGRGGYVKLALRTRSPLIPVAVVGAEEAYPMFARPRFLSKAAGVPFMPITPTFPWLGPVGLLPLPSRWQITFGPPIEGLDGYGPEEADDIALVNELNTRIRGVVQKLVDDARVERGEKVFV